jgi:L-lysine exporter family protein LysE/ArgO
MNEIFLQGFLLQASLIMALGAQNIFVLNSGLRKQRHLQVAFVSSVCDTLLIFVGVLGAATVFVQMPLFKIFIGMAGVGFLLFYGILKFKEVNRTTSIAPDHEDVTSVKQVLMTSLGFSLMNPHVYLDTVVLVGGYATKFTAMSERIAFGCGASVFSTAWFFGLSILASSGRRLLNNTNAMRVVSLVSGIVLTALAAELGMDVFGWMQASH